MKVIFRTYTGKEGEPEHGYYEVLQYLEGLTERDLTVRVDYNKRSEYSLEEEDFFFPSLKISKLKLTPIKEAEFEASFSTKDLRNVFVFLLTLGKHGNSGHSYTLSIGKKEFGIDGDGADYLVSINGVEVNKIKEKDIYHWHEIYEKGTEEDINNNVFKLNESQLRTMVEASITRILKEGRRDWDDDDDERPIPGYAILTDIYDIKTGVVDDYDGMSAMEDLDPMPSKREALEVIRYMNTYPDDNVAYDLRYANNWIPIYEIRKCMSYGFGPYEYGDCTGVFYMSKIDRKYYKQVMSALMTYYGDKFKALRMT